MSTITLTLTTATVTAGMTIRVKKRVTERLIRIPPTNHTLIRGVKRESVRDSRNLRSDPIRRRSSAAAARADVRHPSIPAA